MTRTVRFPSQRCVQIPSTRSELTLIVPTRPLERSIPKNNSDSSKVQLTGDATQVNPHTTSTALRLAVGHAFVSDYTRRFRPDIPESDNACECGWPDRSWLHVVYECPRFNASREAAYPHTRWVDLSPTDLLTDPSNTRAFMGYLQHSRAAFKPRNDPTVPFDPG